MLPVKFEIPDIERFPLPVILVACKLPDRLILLELIPEVETTTTLLVPATVIEMLLLFPAWMFVDPLRICVGDSLDTWPQISLDPS